MTTEESRWKALGAGVLTVLLILSNQAIAQVCRQTDKLLPDDGALLDNFGRSVAIEDGLAVIGSPGDDDNGFSSGSAYLFDLQTGEQITKIVPADGAEDDRFGSAVAISSGVVAISATGSDKVYLIEASTGEQIGEFVGDKVGGNFGESVAMSDGMVVVGAPGESDSGAAYLFDVLTGDRIAKWRPDDAGTDRDFFGEAVAIGGGFVVVGAPWDNEIGTRAGSVYLFDAGTGEALGKLFSQDGVEEDRFGSSVSIADGIVVAGAPQDDNLQEIDTGAAYVFDAETGEQRAKVVADDPGRSDYFGSSVAIAGGYLVVGAWGDGDNGTRSGSAYLIILSTGEQLAKLLPDDGIAYAEFGRTVALDGGVILIGAHVDDDNGEFSGSAYVFDVDCTQDRLTLEVDNLVAGEQAHFLVRGGTPGAKVLTVFGYEQGLTVIDEVAGYCATFRIDGVEKRRVLGGFNQVFNVNGETGFDVDVPGYTVGLEVFFQSAEQGTCPDERTSNLIVQIIQ